MIFANQFLQLSSRLPSKYIYGIGEHRSRFLLSTKWQRFTLFNHDTPPRFNVYKPSFNFCACDVIILFFGRPTCMVANLFIWQLNLQETLMVFCYLTVTRWVCLRCLESINKCMCIYFRHNFATLPSDHFQDNRRSIQFLLLFGSFPV